MRGPHNDYALQNIQMGDSLYTHRKYLTQGRIMAF